MLNQRLKAIFHHAATTLMLVAPALYNRYPLIYFDTGSYMEMSVALEPSLHRAIGYPVLMRLTSWLVSNWPLVLLQGLLVSWLLHRVVGLFFAERRQQRWTHFALVAVLAFSSSLSWYVAQLMPDIFTFILALATALLLLEREASMRRVLVYSAIVLVSLPTHLGNVPIVVLVLASLAVWQWIAKRKLLGKKQLLAIGIPVVLAFLFSCTHNALHRLGFRYSLASNVFITANIGEMGFLKLYLDENCADKNLSLCAIKDSLPLETGGYLWDDAGPVQTHLGGWAGANEEYAVIVHDFLTKPRYLKWFVVGAVKATVKQMFHIDLGSGLQYKFGVGSSAYWPMRTHFKHELNEYLCSVQNRKGSELPLDFFQKVNYVSLFLALLAIGWTVYSGEADRKWLSLLGIVLLFYFFNAAVTGVLANVYERLQCRVLPLVQMAGVLAYQLRIKNYESECRH